MLSAVPRCKQAALSPEPALGRSQKSLSIRSCPFSCSLSNPGASGAPSSALPLLQLLPLQPAFPLPPLLAVVPDVSLTLEPLFRVSFGVMMRGEQRFPSHQAEPGHPHCASEGVWDCWQMEFQGFFPSNKPLVGKFGSLFTSTATAALGTERWVR